MKSTYEFSLRFAVPVRAMEPDDWIDALAKHGCDDALVGSGVPGCLTLDFDRAGDSAESALRSPIADVQRAISEVRLIEAAPDFVGTTETS